MSSRIHRDCIPRGCQVFFLRVLFLSLLFYLGFAPFVSASTRSGKVLRVLDGDTFLIRVQGREEHVRLREIDAPEITHQRKVGQEPWGRRAKDFAQSLVRGKAVRLEVEEPNERDKYHRLLAYVFTDHVFVNREMILSGNAFFYPGPFRGKYANELQEAEETAREKGLGVWDKKKGLKESPQEFRRRTQRDESLFSKLWGAIRGEGKKSGPREYPVPRDKFVANKRTMIYHPPGSPGAARVNPKNRILFDTPEEAEKAGFRRAHPAPERNSRSSLEILTRASWNRTGIMPQKFVPNLSIIFVSERLTAKKVALF
jgi:micrococcal nuclease